MLKFEKGKATLVYTPLTEMDRSAGATYIDKDGDVVLFLGNNRAILFSPRNPRAFETTKEADLWTWPVRPCDVTMLVSE
jgi:hypothetical protein